MLTLDRPRNVVRFTSKQHTYVVRADFLDTDIASFVLKTSTLHHNVVKSDLGFTYVVFYCSDADPLLDQCLVKQTCYLLSPKRYMTNRQEWLDRELLTDEILLAFINEY